MNKVELRDHVRETVQLVEEQADLLETMPPEPCCQFAAAGLMRCCELLFGICVLEDANLGATAGEIPHLETALGVGLQAPGVGSL